MSLMMLSMVFLQLSRAVASHPPRGWVRSWTGDRTLTDRDASRKDPSCIEGKVGFKHVSFSYTDNRDEMVLEGYKFYSKEPGQIIGIISSTGSGRTTLVQDDTTGSTIPQRGQVLVDGWMSGEYSLKTCGKAWAWCSRKMCSSSGTIGRTCAQGGTPPWMKSGKWHRAP